MTDPTTVYPTVESEETRGPDSVPSPSLEQVREYPGIEGREHATGLSERLAGISAHGARRTPVPDAGKS